MDLADGRLSPESFAMRLAAELSTEAQNVLGGKAAREIVSLVGLGMGEDMEAAVAGDVEAEGREGDPEALGRVLVELKRRIGGDFSIESADRDRVVLSNRRCPFGDLVVGRPAMCMMTSSVFGGIAARRFGWARVDIAQAIARGDAGCRVVVHLRETAEAPGPDSTEYHGEGSTPV